MVLVEIVNNGQSRGITVTTIITITTTITTFTINLILLQFSITKITFNLYCHAYINTIKLVTDLNLS